MITKFYKATSGYHDVPPGMSELQFSVRTTDDGEVISQPKNKFQPEFNEVQVEGDKNLRIEFLHNPEDADKILFLDNPEYKKLKLRLSTMATKQIPLNHSDCFVTRWLVLSNSTQENIERGDAPTIPCYVTESGDWGGITTLSLKKEMLPYIKEMDDETKAELESAPSSREFARKFVDWRDTLTQRMTYQPIEDQ